MPLWYSVRFIYFKTVQYQVLSHWFQLNLCLKPTLSTHLPFFLLFLSLLHLQTENKLLIVIEPNSCKRSDIAAVSVNDLKTYLIYFTVHNAMEPWHLDISVTQIINSNTELWLKLKHRTVHYTNVKKKRKGGLGSKQGHRKIHQESKISILKAIKLPCVKTNWGKQLVTNAIVL